MSKKILAISLIALSVFVYGCGNNNENLVNNDSQEIEVGYEGADSGGRILGNESDEIPVAEKTNGEVTISEGARDLGSVDIVDSFEEPIK